jgi:hypothetical protein
MRERDFTSSNFAPGEVPETPLSQPGRGLVGLVGPAERPVERKPDEGLNPKNYEHSKAYSESITESPAVDCKRGTVAGGSFGTDLCLWEDLEIGEAFYLPFTSATLFKTGAESYGIAPNEPEFEWHTSGPGREPVWIIARAAIMQCRRCGCREETPCDDKRLQGPCGWIAPGLCSACLNAEEFEDFLDGLYRGRNAA